MSSDRLTSKVYFASDFHLGAGGKEASRSREKVIVAWLESISADARTLYLVGDVFDYWFEYQWSIPKGYVRLLGMLARMIDAGIAVHFLKGNHDMWVYDYFTDEIGMQVHEEEVLATMGGKRFYIAHGDGLGEGERNYKIVRSVLRNSGMQKLYSRLHPSWGLRLMKVMSARSRSRHGAPKSSVHDLPIAYANQYLKNHEVDYFIMGHRHEPMDYLLANGRSRYLNLGDWLTHCTYAVWDGTDVRLTQFKSQT